MLSNAIKNFLDRTPTDVYYCLQGWHLLQALAWAFSQPETNFRHVFFAFEDSGDIHNYINVLTGVVNNTCTVPLLLAELQECARETNILAHDTAIQKAYTWAADPKVRVHYFGTAKFWNWIIRPDLIAHDDGAISYRRNSKTGELANASIFESMATVLCHTLKDRTEKDDRVLYWNLPAAIRDLDRVKRMIVYRTFNISRGDAAIDNEAAKPLDAVISELESAPSVAKANEPVL